MRPDGGYLDQLRYLEQETRERFTTNAQGRIYPCNSLTWSSDKPAIPGCYFVRDAEDKKPYFVEIIKDFEIKVTGLSKYGSVPISAVINAEWAGPIIIMGD